MQVISVALSKINQRTNSFSKVFVWGEGNMECALQAVFMYNRSRDTWCLTVERSFIRQSNDPKNL